MIVIEIQASLARSTGLRVRMMGDDMGGRKENSPHKAGCFPAVASNATRIRR
jgi:hypothetical protein